MEQYTTNSNSSTEQIVVQAGQIQQQVWEPVCFDHPSSVAGDGAGACLWLLWGSAWALSDLTRPSRVS